MSYIHEFFLLIRLIFKFKCKSNKNLYYICTCTVRSCGVQTLSSELSRFLMLNIWWPMSLFLSYFLSQIVIETSTLYIQ